MAGSIREALEQAYDKVEESGDVETDHALVPIVDDEPVVKALDTGGDEGVDDDKQVVPVKEPVKTPSTVKPAQKAVAKPAAGQSQAGDKTDAAAPPVVSKYKAPQSWKPGVRESFAKLSPEVQEEIARRETEINRGLSEAANSRRFHQEFSNIVRPFEALIAGSNVTPLRAVQNLMATAATLQTGTQAQRAHTVANIIKAYGVDIATLDAILGGQPAPKTTQANDEIMRAIDARLRPYEEQRTQIQRQQQEQVERLNTEAAQTIEEFAADPQNKYYEDLRLDMADLLDMAAQRGRPMTIQEAYERAGSVHPEISKLVAKEKALAAASKSKGNVDRARRASISQPGGTPGSVRGSAAKPVGIRASIAQAWDDLSSPG